MGFLNWSFIGLFLTLETLVEFGHVVKAQNADDT